MKIIIIATFLITAILACNVSGSKQYSASSKKHENFIVVLDLSDRLIQNRDQIDIDTNAIRSAFEKFKSAVQQNLIVKSKDKFSVRIIPQKNSPLDHNFYQNSLSLDLSEYNAGEKGKELRQFEASFGDKLKDLYQKAILGQKSSDYFGVDIWQYFNEQITSDLLPNYQNRVLVLTDGYFDFEDHDHGINTGTTSTTTLPLLKMLNGLNWRSKAEKDNLGIVPVKVNNNAKWLICGIQPKSSCSDLLEADKLGYLWTKWLKQSGATNILPPIVNSPSGKIKRLITLEL